MTATLHYFLWLSADASRYFLIPAGPTFMSGNFLIVNYEGYEQGVTEDSIISFEVNRQEAQDHLEGQLKKAGEGLKKAFHDLALFTDGVSPVNAPPHTDTGENQEAMEKLLAALLGSGDAKAGPRQEEMQQKIKEYLSSNEMKDTFTQMSGKLDKLSQKIKQPGILGNDLPEIIASLAGSLEEEEDVQKAEKRKEELRKTISESIAAALRKKQD
jgi:hypothetical protein